MNVWYFIMKGTRYTPLATDREEKQLLRRDWIDIDPASSAIEADVAVHQSEDRIIAAEADVLAGFNIQKIDIYHVAFRDAILPSASLDDCVGHKRFSGEKKPRKVSQKPQLGKQKVGAVHRTARGRLRSIAPT